jgi:hypothetical protein
MTDPPFRLDPFGGADGGPNFDPTGPEGDLIDLGSDGPPRTVRERLGDPRHSELLWQYGGWVRGPEGTGTAMPASYASDPIPEAAKYMASRQISTRPAEADESEAAKWLLF